MEMPGTAPITQTVAMVAGGRSRATPIPEPEEGEIQNTGHRSGQDSQKFEAFFMEFISLL